jgi:hypothetical protein
MAKHVIILGAGASKSSGYPLAAKSLGNPKPNDPSLREIPPLREILSSDDCFGKYVEKELGNLDSKGHVKETLVGAFKSLLGTREGRLFQTTSYKTVDEFSFSLRNNQGYHALVNQLKRFTSVVFAVHDPIRGQSNNQPDYVTFVQKLFNEQGHDLREDISVLTYNYDPYLEFVLSGQFKNRREVAGRDSPKIPTALLSDFGDRDADGLLGGAGFCLLKLHGTSVLPCLDFLNPRVTSAAIDSILTFTNVFEDRSRLPNALKGEAARPPMISFPWERIAESGNFTRNDPRRESEVFSLPLNCWKGRRKTSDHQLFRAIWLRGQREITDAEKISFVGLQPHGFLAPGLQFLFKKRAEKLKAGDNMPLEVVTANPDSVPEKYKGSSPPYNGHVDRLERMLREACPNLTLADIPDGKRGLGSVACYDDFASFIQHEM